MSNSRRNFIKSAATISAVSTVPVAGSVLACDTKETEQLSGVDLSPFNQALGDEVAIVDTNGITHTAVLDEVVEMPYECQHHQRPAYLPNCAHAVRFTLDDATAFSNEVYRLKHPDLGEMDLLMAVVPDADGQLGLEAIFN